MGKRGKFYIDRNFRYRNGQRSDLSDRCPLFWLKVLAKDFLLKTENLLVLKIWDRLCANQWTKSRPVDLTVTDIAEYQLRLGGRGISVVGRLDTGL